MLIDFDGLTIIIGIVIYILICIFIHKEIQKRENILRIQYNYVLLFYVYC